MERMTCVNYILNDADTLPEVFGSAKEISNCGTFPKYTESKQTRPAAGYDVGYTAEEILKQWIPVMPHNMIKIDKELIRKHALSMMWNYISSDSIAS